jgi:hypothetical protein
MCVWRVLCRAEESGLTESLAKLQSDVMEKSKSEEALHKVRARMRRRRRRMVMMLVLMRMVVIR